MAARTIIIILSVYVLIVGFALVALMPDTDAAAILAYMVHGALISILSRWAFG